MVSRLAFSGNLVGYCIGSLPFKSLQLEQIHTWKQLSEWVLHLRDAKVVGRVSFCGSSTAERVQFFR